MGRLDPILNFLARPFIRLGISPNALTWGGMALLAVASLLLAMGLRWAALAVYAVGAVCDTLDGRVARATGKVSSWGAFLDSSLDRVAEIFVALGIVGYFHHTGWLTPALTAWIAASIGFSHFVPYLRARTESLGLSGKVGLLQRQHRGVLILAGIIGGPAVLYGVVVTIAVLSVFTAMQRMQHCRKALEAKDGA